MIIMKFGGTSVENTEALAAAIDIIRDRRDRQPVVILSAIAGATNTLLKAARWASHGSLPEAVKHVDELLERHCAIARTLLLTEESRTVAEQELRKRFDEIKSLYKGLSLLGELTKRSLDTIVSAGELSSSMLLAAGMRDRGLNAQFVDARTFMLTNDKFTAAEPQFPQIRKHCPETLLPLLEHGIIPVTQGFLGATANGITTTLGRGGSDYSAAIIGSALNAEEIQIWTDVDGILTADPRIVPDALRVREVSFREASELAYFGAKVLHPSTIFPAVEQQIPVLVLNARSPQAGGTRVTAQPTASRVAVKSIASKKSITVINIQSTRMLMAYGFLESIFSVFSKYQTPVDLVSTSEVAVSLTIDDIQHLEAITKELQQFAEVNVLFDCAIVCVVGEQLGAASHVAQRVFRALEDINVHMISQGASTINMSFAIDEQNVPEAVSRLHREFFGNGIDSDLFEQVVH